MASSATGADLTGIRGFADGDSVASFGADVEEFEVTAEAVVANIDVDALLAEE